MDFEPRVNPLHFLSRFDFRGRAGRRPWRLCLWPRGRGGLALYPHAAANRNPDHRVRTDRAGLCGVEASARAGVAQIAPLIFGAAFGVPIGVWALAHSNPHYLRIGVGIVLVLFALYGLFRPAMKPIAAGGMPADIGAGFLNGLLGGATGFGGIVATIWCQLRGWPKDQQRAVFQPVGVGTFAMSALWLGGRGAVSRDVVWLFVLGLPVCSPELGLA